MTTEKISKALTPKEANEFCVWLQDELVSKEKEIKEANLQNGLLKIACEQKAGLLESCEIALNERDQQNEALMAQAEELRDAIYLYAETGRHEQWQEVTRVMAKTPQQSLDSLKARIEEETIDRCVEVIRGIKAKQWIDHVNNPALGKGETMAKIGSMPRKYQPSTKAAKG